jgi:hypothetical protein
MYVLLSIVSVSICSHTPIEISSSLARSNLHCSRWCLAMSCHDCFVGQIEECIHMRLAKRTLYWLDNRFSWTAKSNEASYYFENMLVSPYPGYTYVMYHTWWTGEIHPFPITRPLTSYWKVLVYKPLYISYMIVFLCSSLLTFVVPACMFCCSIWCAIYGIYVPAKLSPAI